MAFVCTQMSKVRVELGDRSYEIVIEAGILARAGAEIASIRGGRGGAVAVVSNPLVAELYGSVLIGSLSKSGIPNKLITVPMGERYKTLASCSRLYEHFLDMKLDRAGMVVALGGGVIGDLAGFAAGTFLRGLDFVQVPTTLLAQVDAAVGGKTAVNLPRGKNLVGVFHQPRRVLIDLETLKTLPRRELRAGLAEVIKHGIIHDKQLFAYTWEHARPLLEADPVAMEVVIRRSCEYKASIVSRDEREAGLRAVLNFGHTFAHAIESATKYRRFRHGEAVAIGMVTAAQLSADLGIARPSVKTEIEDVLAAVGLPTRIPADLEASELLVGMGADKKVLAGKTRLVLIRGIGEPEIVENVASAKIENAIRTLQRQ